jgi:hypothetical protein
LGVDVESVHDFVGNGPGQIEAKAGKFLGGGVVRLLRGECGLHHTTSQSSAKTSVCDASHGTKVGSEATTFIMM